MTAVSTGIAPGKGRICGRPSAVAARLRRYVPAGLHLASLPRAGLKHAATTPGSSNGSLERPSDTHDADREIIDDREGRSDFDIERIGAQVAEIGNSDNGRQPRKERGLRKILLECNNPWLTLSTPWDAAKRRPQMGGYWR